MTQIIGVVDYGMGNLHSVCNALQQVASPSDRIVLCTDADQLRRADRVVFPGQGAMPDCMKHLLATGMDEVLRDVARNRPFFGMCMGEQMLFGMSEEGHVAGLGILPGRIVRLPEPAPAASGAERLKVPHMGWNRVHQERAHPLWAGIPQDEHFYFVHSYHVVPDDPSLTLATTRHGVVFTCSIGRDNIFATQFHPEKSAGRGLQLYHNFLSWRP